MLNKSNIPKQMERENIDTADIAPPLLGTFALATPAAIAAPLLVRL